MEKISIIVPAYNVEKKLDRCLESLVNQTYKNIEIIICDDSSSDDTWEVMKKWADIDNRISIIRNEENIYAAATRNRCIELATGDYIALQDADDYSSLDRLEIELTKLKEHPEYDFVCSTIVCFDDSGVWNEIKFKEYPEKKDFIWGISFTHASAMFKSNSIKNIGGYRVSEETRRGEDLDLFIRLYAAGYKGFNIPDNLYFYNEDREAYKRRKYRYRIGEAIIRYKGYKKLKLFPLGFLGVIKPLIVGLIPNSIHKRIKGILYKRGSNNEK